MSLPPRFLLLVPPLQDVKDDELVAGIVGDTIKQVLQEVALASNEHAKAAILEIALALPNLLTYAPTDYQRYDETQKQIAKLYRCICIIAAREKINIEDQEGVDVRVLLVAWGEAASERPESHGLIPSLSVLARCKRQWQYAFGVETELGGRMVSAFVSARSESSTIQTASSEVATTRRLAPDKDSELQTCVAVGGTFDHIHVGHKLLLTMTVFTALDRSVTNRANRIIIVGITGDQLLKNKKFAEYLESWHDRQKAVQDVIEGLINFESVDSGILSNEEVRQGGPNGHSVNVKFSTGVLLRCVEIEDPFGPTTTEANIDALVISAETRSGGKAVNDKRVEQGWHPLRVLEVDVLDVEEATTSTTNDPTHTRDFSSKISSTEIRRRLDSKTRSSAL